MIRVVAQLVITLIANTLGLWVASILLDGFSINNLSFLVAVALFTLSTFVLGPLITKIALTNAPYLIGGISLVTTLIGLIITDIFSDGLSITGLSTWIGATVVVWLFSMIANVLLPFVLFKKVLQKNQSAKSNPSM